MKSDIHILLVEDSPTDVLLTKEALSTSHFHVSNSQRLGDAINLLLVNRFDVVLLDLGLPDSQGIDTLRMLREKNAQVAIVVLTGKDDEQLALQALKEGAQDYLVKGDIQEASLQRAIRHAVERSNVEKLFRQSEERYRTLITATSAIVWSSPASGEFDSEQPSWTAFTGQTVEQHRGLGWLNAIHPDDREHSARAWKTAWMTGTEYRVEHRLRRADGEYRQMSARGVPILETKGSIREWIGVHTDVTEQKSLESQMLQAQKMEAFGQLAGGVAHDFNNLLTIISGYSEIMLGELDADNPMRESVTAICEAGEQAAGLTRQLLAFSRKTVLEPKVLNPNDVVRETQKLLRRLIGEDILLTAVLDPNVSKVKIDPGLLAQVLMNLAVNARDAMPMGGKLTIETSNVFLNEDYAARHVDCVPGSHVRLAVSDNGCGMPPAIRARIFEPFFTTKELGKGTGLGLATVFGIVKQSGGNINLYTEPGHGSTFKIYLPAFDEQPNSQSSGPTSRKVLGGTETILVVEDEDAVRTIAVLALQTRGYKVLQAENGKKALRLVETHQGLIDLLVTDVVMPGMSGRELAEALIGQTPTLKVLFQSGYTDDAVIRHGILQADVAFLQKPYTPLSLSRKVREVLDEQ
ncbi:response regulator [Zavarzinella formosa]|uniref:response regulator n=1 Tax=Zavarzinella formosa TaxID=360055 RepID=UPI000310D1D4|nr:response regulator [Zavarzinella formosa]